MLSKSTTVLTLACLIASTLALPVHRREVPQEHCHEKFLTAVNALLKGGNPAENNPLGIVDAVFGLLGDAAAANGAGEVSDVKCLQQATADQAFTNAKKAGDIAGMTAALNYRTLERNTGQVGLKSDLCESIQAVNPEIAALTQHQDPASEGAKEANKALVLELARQIASIGGDPLAALETGTFAPGDVNDATAKGNTCNDVPDPVGCIFTKNLLVPDASEAEIQAAVADIGAGTETANQDGNTIGEVPNDGNKGSGEATTITEPTATGAETVTTTAVATGAATDCPSQATVTVTVTAGAVETGAATDGRNHARKGPKKVAAGIVVQVLNGAKKTGTASSKHKNGQSSEASPIPQSANDGADKADKGTAASAEGAATAKVDEKAEPQEAPLPPAEHEVAPAPAAHENALKMRFFKRTFV